MDDEPRIVLTMIVKNESKVIERCLANALPYIDGYVIADTGSTDDTIEIIRRVLADKPGMIVNDEWTDFGWNRTRSAEAARHWVKEKSWDLDRTYLLLLDADMVLRAHPSYSRSRLTGPHYRIPQVDPGLRYYNTRLARLSQRWRAVGVTHEYWAPTPDCGVENIDYLWIDDRGDGGSKGNKTVRDIELLKKGLVEEPENGRYMFYLAQSLSDAASHVESESHVAEHAAAVALQENELEWALAFRAESARCRARSIQYARDAIEWYGRRIRIGGWEEEVWYSAYKRGAALLHLAKLTGTPEPAEQGAGALLEAYQRRPQRAEPLVSLARHYREQGKNQLAYMNARQALDMPYPDGDTLFVDEPMNKRGALEEIAITAYYLDRHKEGMAAAEALLGNVGNPPGVHHQASLHASFYVQPLAPHALRKGEFTVAPEIRSAPGKFFGLEEPNTTEYLCSNPTIVEHDGKTYANVRLVNYYHERGRVFAPKDPDSIVRTRNVIQEWDVEAGDKLWEKEVTALLPEEWDHTTRVRGLEDQRWVSHQGRIWLTATCFNIPGAEGNPRVVLGRLNEALDTIEQALELKYEGTTRYEKNWLPWPKDDGELYVVYGYWPFVVLRVDTETGACSVVSRTMPEFATARWRGSCAPVRSPAGGDRWIAAIHETAWFEGSIPRDQRTVYMHRWIEITGDRISRRSPLFTWDRAGVEYAAGLLVRGDKLIATHSVEESSAHWKEFEWELVDRMLDGKMP